MAQLKDLIVYGDTKFLGDVTLDHDPTASLHAATKAYVDSQVGTGTDEKLKVAALTSGTTYLPILAVSTDSGTAATRQIDSNAQAFKYICTPGTSGGTSKGTAQLILGNGISEGYVNSAAGQLTIFGNAMYGVTLKYGAAYSNQTLMLPAPTDGNQTNYLLSKIGSAAVGAADQPVYFDSNGRAVLANKIPWGVGGTNATRPGIFYPNNLIGTFGSATVTVGEIDSDGGHIIDGITNSGTGAFMMAGWTTQALTESHSAGSTTYTISAAATWTDWTKFQFVQSQAPYSLVSPTSFTINNDGYGVLTFENSLNPTAAVTSIRYVNKNTGMHSFMSAYGTNEAQASLLEGLGIYNSGSNSLVAGRYIQNTGSTSIIAGQSLNNSGAVSAIFGYYNKNTVLGTFMAGKWHDSTNGSNHVAAVGCASLISSDSAFVVGNGTDASTRSNAFEVHTDGRATVGAGPTANMDVATKQYVDGLSSTWKLTSQGGLISQFNTAWEDTIKDGAVVIASTSTWDSIPLQIQGLCNANSNDANLVIPTGNYITVTSSAPAGSTTYTLRTVPRAPDGTADHLLDILFGYDSNVPAQKPTSISFDSNGYAVLTFATSLNPNSTTTRLYPGTELDDASASITAGGGILNSGVISITNGTFIKNTGPYGVITGQNVSNTGSIFLISGSRVKNTGSYAFLSGSDLLNTSGNYSMLVGLGHSNTTGPAAMAAVGQYSSITSTTQFVVGNGTSASARSNAFEVTTTGEAKALSFTENGTSLVNKYAAKSHTHGDIDSGGAITTNPGITIASGDALLIADSSLGNTIKKSATTFGTSTTTYLRNDGTWGTPTGTDTKVSLTSTTTSASYPLALGPTSITSGSAYGEYYNTSFYVNPSTLVLNTPKLTVNGGVSSYTDPVQVYTTGATNYIATFRNNTTTTSSTTYTYGVRIYAPNMVANTGAGYANFAAFDIGVSAAACNSGNMVFHYSGSGSTSNFVGFGLYSHNNILAVAGTDRVGIMNTAPSYTLDVTGTIHASVGVKIGTSSEIKSIGSGLSVDANGALCADVGSDTKVTQSAITGTSTTTFYPILLAYGTGQTATTTNTANFSANAAITPSGDISANKMTSSTTFNYGANAYTQYNAALKAIEFCFA